MAGNIDDDGGTDDLLVSWLDSLGYEDLVDEIIGLAEGDPGIGAVLRARAAVRTVDDMLSDGDVHEAISLARSEFTLAARAASVAGPVPGSLADEARLLLDAHLRACQAADPPPDPVGLGVYLANLILDDTAGLTPSLEAYGSLLGRAGTLAIRDRITAVYQANPGHANARHMTGSLAGPPADAALHQRRARHRAEQSLDSYRALRAAARQSNTWNAERISALAQLRPPVLVDALLDDGDLNYAWEVLPDDAPEEQRLRLADASLALRPERALREYLAVIEPLSRQTGEAAYARLVRLLTQARDCHEALGSTDEFSRYMAGLRETCKRRRNLITLLDQAGL
ncbi:MAG: hypothetical protein FWE35_16755 [Streptosporangiales bacterium]|nr:hypothetical protein [Streptosporangiales bacterium]